MSSSEDFFERLTHRSDICLVAIGNRGDTIYSRFRRTDGNYRDEPRIFTEGEIDEIEANFKRGSEIEKRVMKESGYRQTE